MPDNTIEQNLAAWDRDHQWSKDGDEWGTGQKYLEWKQSVIEHLVRPFVAPTSTVLEIAPGHGRWTEFLLDCKRLILVDLSPSCIDYCRKRSSGHHNISYHVGDGRSLPENCSGEVDFVFSFDSRDIGARRLYRYISMGAGWHKDGWRSNVSKELFARSAHRAGLTVERQNLFWADGFGVSELNDRVTVLSKSQNS